MDTRNFVYRHEKYYRVRYTDVDFEDKLKLSSLLSFLNEGACTSADELGFGYDVVKKLNYGFILVNWYIRLDRPVRLGDSFHIITWPIRPLRSELFRDYEMYCGDEKVGAAISRWCLVDLSSFRILPTAAVYENPDLNLHINFNDFRSVESPVSWKIPPVENGETVFSRQMRFSDYDHYNHVNNTKYADFMMDAFSVDELRGRFPSLVQMSYVKQCKEGDVLDVSREFRDGYYLVDGKVSGETRIQMKIAF